MLKKTIQTLFIFIAISAFAQQKDRLGVPGPLKMETAASVVEFQLTKSSVNAKSKVITQEYQPKSKSGERILISFYPGSEALGLWEKRAEDLKGSKDEKISEIEMNTQDDDRHSIKFMYTADKTPERREILIGNINASEAIAKGSYVLEYFGGNAESELSLEKVPEMIQIKPQY